VTAIAAHQVRHTGGRLIPQTIALGKRSIISTLRQPQQWIPSFAFPLLLCAVNTAALTKVIKTQGLDSYLNFALGTVVVQGVLFSASNAGSDLATDIQLGFFDRLVSSPVARSAILVGRLAGSFVLGILQALIIIGVLAIFGARVQGGLAGILVLALAGGILSLAIGSLSCAVAVRTGSAEAVQGFNPLFTMFIFFSSAYFPKTNMVGWFRALVDKNPLNWAIEGVRSIVLDGVTANGAAKALLVPLAIAVVGVAIATRAMRRRLGASA
jgi:ABC-2 type transport system permease protein